MSTENVPRLARTARVDVLFTGYAADRVAGTVSLIRDVDRVMVLDPGMVPARSAILDPLRALGVSPEQVTDVLLSHHHPDHTVNIALFREVPVHDFQAVYTRDEWTDRPADGVDLTPSVRLLATPGHTPQDLTVLVGTPDQVIALTHLWWSGRRSTARPVRSRPRPAAGTARTGARAGRPRHPRPRRPVHARPVHSALKGPPRSADGLRCAGVRDERARLSARARELPLAARRDGAGHLGAGPGTCAAEGRATYRRAGRRGHRRPRAARGGRQAGTGATQRPPARAVALRPTGGREHPRRGPPRLARAGRQHHERRRDQRRGDPAPYRCRAGTRPGPTSSRSACCTGRSTAVARAVGCFAWRRRTRTSCSRRRPKQDWRRRRGDHGSPTTSTWLSPTWSGCPAR